MIKLSICMMVKNEEKNLMKCLESLNPILNHSDVELVIIDTGSNDNTVSIAQNYTDKVYHHEWNDSFSDMRNISISYARGEWLFIYDADEVLMNSEKMYLLLKTPNFNNFNTIKIREKNYLNKKLTDYIIHETDRLFKNNGFKYIGTVHNQPLSQEPVYFAEDIWLEHFGYINDDIELMEKKFHRTATLLKKELEENPNNIYYLYQLNKSYCMIQKYDEAYKQIKKAYDLIESSPSQKLKNDNLVVYGELARVAMTNKKFDIVKKACEEGLAINQNYMDLHFLLGQYYYLLNNKSKKAIEHYNKFLMLYKKYSNEMFNENYVQELFTLREEYRNQVLLKIAQFHFEEEDYNTALKFLEKSSDELNKISLKVKILLAKQSYNEIFNYFKKLKLEKNITKQDMNAYSHLEEERLSLNHIEKEKLTSVFAYDEGIYGLFNKVRLDPGNPNLLNQFFYEKKDNLPDFFLEIYVYQLQDTKIFIQKLNAISTNKIKSIVEFALNHDKKNLEHFIDLLIISKVREKDYHSNRALQAIGNVVLLEVNRINKRNIWGITEKQNILFNRYIYMGINYIQMLYQKDRLRYMYSTLPDSEDKFLIIMHLLNEEKTNPRKAIQYFKEALNCYPYYAEYLEEYRKKILIYE